MEFGLDYGAEVFLKSLVRKGDPMVVCYSLKADMGVE